jgi:hypothetical protein
LRKISHFVRDDKYYLVVISSGSEKSFSMLRLTADGK